MDYTIFVPVLISFALSVIMGPVVIPVLRRLKMDQTEREEGVKSHLKKAGTPTMGGVIILTAVVLTSVIYIGRYPNIIPILFVTLGFGLIGFLDDYLKVVLKRSDGLFPRQKMALQILVTAVFAFYLVKFTDVPLTMLIPFSGGRYLDIGWLAIPLLFLTDALLPLYGCMWVQPMVDTISLVVAFVLYRRIQRRELPQKTA